MESINHLKKQPEGSPERLFIRVKEAAAALDVSEETIKRWVRSRPPLLMAAKIGRTVRIPRSEIARLAGR
jgi:excisionase family DNA binding protein